MGTVILQEIISILYAGITGVATALGAGLSALAQNVMVSGTGTSEDPYALTTFAVIVVVFAGIGLAVGLSKMIVKWVMSLGARH